MNTAVILRKTVLAAAILMATAGAQAATTLAQYDFGGVANVDPRYGVFLTDVSQSFSVAGSGTYNNLTFSFLSPSLYDASAVDSRGFITAPPTTLGTGVTTYGRTLYLSTAALPTLPVINGSRSNISPYSDITSFSSVIASASSASNATGWSFGSAVSINAGTQYWVYTYGTGSPTAMNFGLNSTADRDFVPRETTGYVGGAAGGVVVNDSAFWTNSGSFGLDTSGAGGAMDANFRLSGDAVVSAVPEPGEWAMMLAGLGVVSAIARRRKAKQAA